jgi:hypothetical protein
VSARVLNANASSLAGELPIEASLPQIWVDDPADAERAKAIIEAFKTAPNSGPAVKCRECGEDNPGTFDLCWNCGRDLTALK